MLNYSKWTMALVAVAVAMTGCARITTQVVEKPRVDQELEGTGNRGYLMGQAPEPGARRQTRQMWQADVELSTGKELMLRRKGQQQPGQAEQPAAPARTTSQISAPAQNFIARQEDDLDIAPVPSSPKESLSETEQKVASATTYTVKKGDTLEKISSKVYGDGSHWKRIYNANRNTLKSPNRIYAGQKLVIPPMSGSPARQAAASSSSDGLK